jgi:N-methylhydantoinase B
VIDGYVSIAAARDLYRVAIVYAGSEGKLVRLPEHFRVDAEATAALRS